MFGNPTALFHEDPGTPTVTAETSFCSHQELGGVFKLGPAHTCENTTSMPAESLRRPIGESPKIDSEQFSCLWRLRLRRPLVMLQAAMTSLKTF